MEQDHKYYKYVPHHQQKKWEDLGWVFDSDLGPPHAAYSSLYRWERDGEPVVPDSPELCITASKMRKLNNE